MEVCGQRLWRGRGHQQAGDCQLDLHHRRYPCHHLCLHGRYSHFVSVYSQDMLMWWSQLRVPAVHLFIYFLHPTMTVEYSIFDCPQYLFIKLQKLQQNQLQ